ncbi:long-chain fatty acid--CoA ligase [Metabacillus herbersteinensis]|uniref:Long-chain fatty acid--CoA ligase n=1 Tax=Metabacillus herbersteinensis TaxID=283816 RepID=A0ABV6GJM1_9BACI
MNHLYDRPWYNVYPPEMIAGIKIPEVPLYTLLSMSTEKFGDHAAIIFEDQKISYHELKDKVDRLAGGWNNLGLTKGEAIGLMLSNHPDYVISYYAAQALGLVVVQINPMYTPRELLQIASDSELKFIVIEEAYLPTVIQVNDIHPFNNLFVSGENSPNSDEFLLLSQLISRSDPFKKITPISVKEDVAVIQYTGGTTGKMKGAMLTHYNLVSNVIQSYSMYHNRMKFGQEIVLTATPLYHVYAMTSAMNLGIYIGASLLLFKKFNVSYVLEKIQTYKPTFFPGVPKMYIAFINYPNVESYGLDSIKICSSGSAPLPVEVIKKFEALTGSTIGEGYGLSETSPSTHRNPPEAARKIGSIGIPLPGTDCKIIDEDSNELPPKSVGELVIKGPQVMKGYWKREEETSQFLKNGWLYTGDLALMDEEGYFYIIGRKKEMIILGGFNIYPQEVESVLYEHPDVKEAAVVGILDRENGEEVKAYIVPKDDCEIDLEELKGHCYRNLTRYKVPKYFEIRTTLPRNTVGKLLKRKLVEEEQLKLKAELT